jgi:hypothetical protein
MNSTSLQDIVLYFSDSFSLSHPRRFTMELSDLVSKNASSDVKLTSAQAKLLMLFKKLVCLIASEAMTDIENVPEVRERPSVRDYGRILRKSP